MGDTTSRVLNKIFGNEVCQFLTLTGRGKTAEESLRGQPVLSLIAGMLLGVVIDTHIVTTK